MSDKRNPILMMKAEEVDYKPIAEDLKKAIEKELPRTFIGLISNIKPDSEQRVGDLYYCDEMFFTPDYLHKDGSWVTVSRIGKKLHYMPVPEDEITEEIRQRALDLIYGKIDNTPFIEALKQI